jgi:outer membrane protein
MNDHQENNPLTGADPESRPAPARKNQLALSVSILSLLIALAALVVVFTTGKPDVGSDTQTASDGKITVAWVNTDSVWEQYDFVTDVKAELAAYEQNLMNQYTASVSAFQNEYNEYIKKASAYQLTLDEQKKTEEKLAKKQQSLQELDAQLSQKLIDEKTTRNMEVHDTIVKFVARFNQKHKYTYILERSYGGSILWADSVLEITSPVIKGLNEEYKKFKKTADEE